jgi:2-C-methyl-D-erythritol 4-phosphate cytidylyltransferase/2-C-methyl-D-erythritol 2,4-cyclodiphosphate synthase
MPDWWIMKDNNRELLKTTAIILAAGMGRRMGGDIPKQFLEMGGKPILAHTVEKFEKAQSIDRIVVVAAEADVDHVHHLITAGSGCSKPTTIVIGGKERQDSVRNGIQSIDDDTEIVIIHDGVRPFISPERIDELVGHVHEAGAVIQGIPVKDTVKEVDERGYVTNTVDRRALWLIQTPQVFLRSVLRDAFDKAYTDGFYGTDDAELVERIGRPVRMMNGSAGNIKITTPDDLEMGSFLSTGGTTAMKVGIGYDSHRLVPGRALILGGVEIPNDMGLSGHSDADVLLHAICDAILGALGDGDIGMHFPDTDPEYKDISSLNLLAMVHKRASDKSFDIGNVDATIIAERPKLRNYIAKMTHHISHMLDVDHGVVNIKATTNEGMGFLGRNEGIAAFSVVSLFRRKKQA